MTTPHNIIPNADPSQTWITMAEQWPHTPTIERLTEALAAWHAFRDSIKGAAGNPPEFLTMTDPAGREHAFDVAHSEPLNIAPVNLHNHDLIALNDCLQSQRLYYDAADLFQRIDFRTPPDRPETKDLTPQQWYAGATGLFIHAMARHADDATTIGIAWQRWRPDIDGKAEYVMTKLSRNRDWLGFNALLTNLQDVKFAVYHTEHDPLLPGYAVGYPSQDTNLSSYERNPFPPGQATNLQKLLLWHGADQCFWTGSKDIEPTTTPRQQK